MEEKILEIYKAWVNEPYFDEETKEELISIKDDEKEIEDRFYKELEFGTAGLRGVIGAGTNRMNKYTVRKTSQGLADHIKTNEQEAMDRGVVIAYDSRRYSEEFAEEAALVLAGNGIKTYLFKKLKSTPELSFAINYLNCISGIVITASHNPPEYNGYKLYWEDGAQIATEKAEEIIASIDSVNNFNMIQIIDKTRAMKEDLLVYLDKTIDDAYIEAIKLQSLRGDLVKDISKDFKIVFTPLHGTGNIPVRRILREIGFENVLVVPEQEKPDSEFSTVTYPNPEDKNSFKLAIELAEKEEADLILGTDPDCDRVGVLVRDDQGEFIALTGDQIGAMLVNYILCSLQEKDRLASNGIIINTIVTSEIGKVIAEDYGIEILNTLTGFKYIGEKIRLFEESGSKKFLFGYEESYGYLAGTHARDKDAVVASMLIGEMAAYYQSKDMTLYDGLMEIYVEYGYYLEDLKSLTLEGKDGLEKIKLIMNYFRNLDIDYIADKKILAIEDYKEQKRRYLDNSKASENIDLPKSNVVKFILEDDAWICLRPSGTEPKLKIYAGVKENSLENSRQALGRSTRWMENKIKKI